MIVVRSFDRENGTALRISAGRGIAGVVTTTEGMASTKVVENEAAING
jgi:hypothetical protein